MEQYKRVKAIAVHGFTFLTPQKWRLFISQRATVIAVIYGSSNRSELLVKLYLPNQTAGKFEVAWIPLVAPALFWQSIEKVADNLEGVREIDFWQVGDLPYPLKVRNSLRLTPVCLDGWLLENATLSALERVSREEKIK
jgi:hypothetical protein